MDALDRLYRSLDARPRPEEVAVLVLEALPNPTRRERAVIGGVAAHASRRHGFSGMSDDYARPVGAARQVAATRRLFDVDGDLHRDVDAEDPLSVLEFAALAGAGIGWDASRTDFLADRLNREARASAGIELSKRQYNRRFRMLRRLSAKAGRLGRAQELRRATLLASAGFVDVIDRDRFRADPAAACFVAYFTARRKLRREFGLAGRENPFDQVADALFARCRASSGTDWAMIALAHPAWDVLRHLSADELGSLLGRWSAAVRALASVLGGLWRESDVDRTTMIVRSGVDSSTWNAYAGAYNTARTAWITCLHAAGLTSLLDPAWPGKAMRVMAADLAWWHRETGGGPHPDTAVWAALPLPWEVLDGVATCTRADVEAACRAHGVDPARSWTAPRKHSSVARFRPTPELVHGVAVSDPLWAMTLRRAGVFSGKPVRAEVFGGPVFGGQDAPG
ncbi:hypothetical protein [Lentzea albida]|uniref:Uncharacterized protein n=1 Tax=Lentzea albida TaxID=65499 RepID=A0A1H9LUE7_9PSEU|nr:hypothetical protein [Lentzea albida]SER15122.1 hypothetical protein SAMN04488000_106285 [Lentzea albida]